MTWTYSQGSTADRNRVRLEIGDTEELVALFSDEELDDFIEQDGSFLGAAAHACEQLATRFARDFTFSADGSKFEKGQRSAAYAVRARALRDRAGGDTIVPTRVDGYSDTIASDEVLNDNDPAEFEAGRWDF
jgi:hypothetical protein